MTKMKILICRDEAIMPFIDDNGVLVELMCSEVQLFPVEDLLEDLAYDILRGPGSVSLRLDDLFDKERSE